MAAIFEMDPLAAQAGLAATAASRASGLAGADPAVPLGNYLSGAGTAVEAVLTTMAAQEAGVVGFGAVTSVQSATAVDTTEEGNVQILSV